MCLERLPARGILLRFFCYSSDNNGSKEDHLQILRCVPTIRKIISLIENHYSNSKVFQKNEKLYLKYNHLKSGLRLIRGVYREQGGRGSKKDQLQILRSVPTNRKDKFKMENSHKELILKRGVYRELWQQLNYKCQTYLY